MGHWKAHAGSLFFVALIVVLVMQPLPVHGAVSLRQQEATAFQGTGSLSGSFTIPFGTNVQAGDVVIVALSFDLTVSSISITDSLHSSYPSTATVETDVSLGHANLFAMALYDTMLTKSGPDIVSITYTVVGGTGPVIEAFIFEISGATAQPTITVRGAGTPVSFQNGAFLLGFIGYICSSCTLSPGPGFTLTTVSESVGPYGPIVSEGQYSAGGVASPSDFPATITGGTGAWDELGIALNPTSPPPIPEYPVGLSIITIFMVLGYVVIKRRTAKTT